MSTSEILSRYYECLSARDVDGLHELLSDDIAVTYYAQPEQLPWAGKFYGRDGFDQFLASVSQHVGIVDADRLDPIIADNHAVVRTIGTWKAHATDKLIHGGMINVFEMRDGQIAVYEVWADTAAFMEGLAT